MMLEYRSVEGIPLEDGHWAKLAELAGRLGTTVPPLPVSVPREDP